MVSQEKASILVVDDLPDKLMVLESVLQELGQNVVTARSGREALRRVLEREFAVILLDVNMPDMDGFETAELIRQRKQSAHTPIIFITAFSDDVHTARGYSLGAVDYIFSPVVPEILRTKVRVFVDLYDKTEQIRQQAEARVTLAREQAARLAAEEATRRSHFLAEASTVLASSLDHGATVRGLLRVAVPYLADLAAVTLVGDPGHVWTSELAWADPLDGVVRPLTLTKPEEPDDEVRRALERVLASGQEEALEDLAVPYPPGASAGASGKLCSALVLPLLARGRTLGALSLAMGASGRRFMPADRALAEDLSGRAAVAIDNARLYRDIQEADRRKNEFLAMLAHELRNPLAPIRCAVHILRQCDSDQPETHWAQDVIDRQVQQMARLVDDLLDISRITRGKITLRMEPVDLATVVSRAVETSRPLIDLRQHELMVSLPQEPLRVEADVTRLAQVVANLLNNAAKYTEEKGRIWLTAERQGGDAVLRVRDSGAGIPEDMLSSIFELFTQLDRSLDRAQGGLGIGLTLVRSLVALHGGRVQAFSAGPNKGSEFVVRLRALAETRPQEQSEESGECPVPCAPRRVLVVDDNADGADSLALHLRLSGHEVQVAYSGPAALKVAEPFRPDVVLLDIGLPGMDGYEVARRLRQQPGLADVVLVAVTGYGTDEDRSRSQEAGFDAHLVKPVDADALPPLFVRQRCC